jgi:hypothetical protein
VHVLRYLGTDDEPSVDEGRAELEEHCRLAGIDPATAEQSRYLHRMVVCGAMPVPEAGGVAGRPGPADAGLEGVLVAGDWVGAEGHLADAALTSGEQAGRRAAEGLGRDPTVHAVAAG